LNRKVVYLKMPWIRAVFRPGFTPALRFLTSAVTAVTGVAWALWI
jgi:hypothetical protein